MCYFADFEQKLNDRYKGDFSSLMDSGYRFDSSKGRGVRAFRELDSRQQKDTGYVKVYDEPPVVVEPPPVEEVDEVSFEVIDLDAEMERRKNITSDSNPVQPEPTTESQSFTMTARSARNSPRGLVSPSKTSERFQVDAKVVGGNRAQRRATSAAIRKKAKQADKGKWKTVRGNNSSSPEAPKVVRLSDLAMGIRWE